jgi:GMP synthase (glutamine-hydrolysing)
MKPFLIIKTGSTLAELRATQGDFEDWMVSGSGLGPHHFTVVNVEAGESLPDYDTLGGILITGSHAMVSERLPWSESAAAWLAGAVQRCIPTLGICYGHQLLAHALGGRVEYNPRGREYGTFEITLTPAAQNDSLLSILPASPHLHVSHSQSVLELPAGAVRLAYSDRDSNQAFCANQCAWGVQFHPEFNAHIMRAYIHHSRAALFAEGQDPQQLMATCSDNPLGSQVLQRFITLAQSAN